MPGKQKNNFCILAAATPSSKRKKNIKSDLKHFFCSQKSMSFKTAIILNSNKCHHQ